MRKRGFEKPYRKPRRDEIFGSRQENDNKTAIV